MANPHIFSFFFFQIFYAQLNTPAYSVPDDRFFINCGSDVSTTFNNHNFVGDVNPNSFSMSAAHSSVAAAINPPSPSALFGTARVFRRASWYKLDIAQNGTFLLRLHFYAFTSQAQGIDLYSARFSVSASKFQLLSDFQVPNTTNSTSIKEFFLNITVGKFKISFIPSGSSSMAFINAIETFIVPGLLPDSTIHVNPQGSGNNDKYDGLLSSNALQNIYRINVGGTSEYPDKQGRTWVPDDAFLLIRGAAVNKYLAQIHDYVQGNATEIDAPIPVYNTAKYLEINDSSLENVSAATWRFNVNPGSHFLVRTHFCDIVSLASTDDLKFNLSFDSIGLEVDPHASIFNLAVPFFYDYVVDSDDSGFMNISISPRQDSFSTRAFLNGLEIMELITNSSSILDEGNEESKNHHLSIIVGSIVGGVVLITVSVVLLLWYCFRVRKGNTVETHDDWELMNVNRGSSYSRSTERNVNGGFPLPDLNLGLKVALSEVLYATKNFSEDLVIGEGGFGKVYRGTLRDGTKVAVKRSEPGRTQGFSEFQTEIMVLSKIRHRHLVSLIGYCDERSEMVLVYEFMEKGTLRDHLYSSSKQDLPAGLPWEKRLELCIDAARGLHYLHTGVGAAIIHRDVKSTNILLDEHFVAKVSDFGISRLGGGTDQSFVDTEVKGSFGYLDPEYYTYLKLTQKSDVYSFGVVLLEVVCARPAINNLLPKEEVNLAEWGMSFIKKGELEKIIDPFLVGKISPDSLRIFGQIVPKCLQQFGDDRPHMVDLLWELEYALRQQQLALPRRQPNENENDDSTNVSYNLPLPLVSRLPSYSIAITEDGMESDTQINNSTNASEVFSQITMQEAR